ncbi:MAG: rRNA pseudouridine synthase, partial [Bacteroidia bacterium]|nr:rRNA pseudouridine synthase [Bacteroidia bacterium]
ERSDSSLGYDKKPYRKKDSFDDNFSSERKSERRRDDFDGDYSSKRSSYGRRSPDEKKSFHKKADRKQVDDGLTRLNKYLSNAGICSRREADELIEAGSVTVNGQVITQLGFKVNPGDKVVYGGDRVRTEKKVYLLLNKPKDYITTTDDPQERRTVMDLIKGACKERVYPVGRLDRNTTGVLLLTNDGETAKKLLHPKHGIAKVYQVTLDKNVSKEDMDQLYDGIELEDGFAKVDNIAYASPLKSKKEIGVEIHSGKNRIVRRMFEQLGYKVAKLDRVSFAGLTKKDLSRGKHRFLTESEIGFLKMIS